MKNKRGRKQDWVGKSFRPQCISDTCERKESRKQEWPERASHHDLDRSADEERPFLTALHKNQSDDLDISYAWRYQKLSRLTSF